MEYRLNRSLYNTPPKQKTYPGDPCLSRFILDNPRALQGRNDNRLHGTRLAYARYAKESGTDYAIARDMLGIYIQNIT